MSAARKTLQTINKNKPMKDIYITASKRTALAAFRGSLSSLSAPSLGAAAIKESLYAAGLPKGAIDEVLMGNVVSAGIGQAPARQASLIAGIDNAVPCTTVSKVCGSGMKAVMLAADSIQCGHASVVMAGGMESMSQAPYLLAKARAGHRLGHSEVKDALFVDGLEDAETGKLMGVFGQKTADDFGISREAMDDFALESLKRAQAATKQGLFANEIAAIDIGKQSNATRVDVDEQLLTAKPEKIRKLKPAFKENGSVTAANSSSISDGAASMIVADEQALSTYNLEPQARIVGHSSHAQSPAEFTLAPIGAINKLLTQVGWTVADVDLFEINEAFAVVTLQAMRALSLDHDKVNIHGGACALGHPLGASGARIIVTLINALIATGGKRGVASLCIGGGEATAIAIEIT